MDKLKTLIVDDEPDSISTLRNFLLEYCPSVVVVGEATSIDEAHQKIDLCAPHLVFLDINMPGGDGFKLLKRI
ncbi:MAG TPA: response regulator, partial [Flavipsychrobacter sp.]|nr:response regulator [Flavipsychrobacter sp.]